MQNIWPQHRLLPLQPIQHQTAPTSPTVSDAPQQHQLQHDPIAGHTTASSPTSSNSHGNGAPKPLPATKFLKQDQEVESSKPGCISTYSKEQSQASSNKDTDAAANNKTPSPKHQDCIVNIHNRQASTHDAKASSKRTNTAINRYRS